MLSIESGLITYGNRIIVPREMQPEMLQYIDESQGEMPSQGKKHCILAKDDLSHSTACRQVYDLLWFGEISDRFVMSS